MNVRSRVKSGAALGAAVPGLAALAAPASADPVPGSGGYRQLVGVGSETTEAVMNALGEVVTGSGCDNVRRPTTGFHDDGSGTGIDALTADTGAGCIDFAPSTRGPVTAGSSLAFVPLAGDGVSHAADLGSTIPNKLSAIQLAEIYRTRTFTDSTGLVRTVRPLLPPHGYRARRLQAIDVSETELGTCVTETGGSNDGTEISNANQLMPYAISQRIVQSGTLPNVPDRRGESRLRAVNGVSPTNGSGTSPTLNPAFTLVHDVYNVFRPAAFTDRAVAQTFVGATSKVSQNPATASNCGATTLGGDR